MGVKVTILEGTPQEVRELLPAVGIAAGLVVAVEKPVSATPVPWPVNQESAIQWVEGLMDRSLSFVLDGEPHRCTSKGWDWNGRIPGKESVVLRCEHGGTQGRVIPLKARQRPVPRFA